MFTTKKIVAVSVINDLVTDSRVNRNCNVLMEAGYEVVLIGRKLPQSLSLPDWKFKAVRMNLIFTQGPAFYLFFNLRLFIKLLNTKADLLFANDLDTLWANYYAAKLKKIPLVYDSHELFCEVPELIHEPLKKKLWESLEKRILPKLKNCITVNQSIANIFEKKYAVKFNVIRNIPEQIKDFKAQSKAQLNLPENKKIILLQGAGINVDRGAEELVDAMKFIDNALLLIIGSGDVWPVIEQKVVQNGLREKVKLIQKIPKKELMSYTFNADLGISIDKNTNPNYYNSLPNKIFDYLQCGVPILASRLPEIENIVKNYKVGWFIDSHEPKHIAETINTILSSTELKQFRLNTVKAAEELNWDNEKAVFLEIIKQIKT